jgi:N-acetylmuramoyl-L-alanine amidase
VWYSPLPTDDALRLRAPGAREASAAWCQSALRAWGYKVGDAVDENGVMDSETRSAVAAFQLHFRPSKFDGVVDAETCDILESLLIEHGIKL